MIEQAVVQANSAGGKYEYLVELIGGVVLLGTPHRGSKSQKWGSIMASLASLTGFGETVLMEEVSEKSMKIFDLVSEFQSIAYRIGLAETGVICFYENLPTNYLSRVTNIAHQLQNGFSSIVSVQGYLIGSLRLRLNDVRWLIKCQRRCMDSHPSSWTRTT